MDTGVTAQEAVAEQLRDAAREGAADQDAVGALREEHGLSIERRGDWLRLYCM